MPDYIFTGRQKDLIVSQVMRQDSALNLNGLYSFPDPPNERILTDAIQRVFSNFISLRTCVKIENGAISPRVVEGTVPVKKIVRQTPREQFDEVYRICQKPFDLFNERPVRAYLVGDGNEIAHMLLQFHHVATDWWSFRIIHESLSDCYNTAGKAFLEKDYLLETNLKSLELETTSDSLQFWNTLLRNRVFSRALPKANKTTHEQCTIRSGFTEIDREARSHGLTLFEYLFLKFAESVTRVTQRNTIVNIPVGNRATLDEVRTVGYLMNVVPIICWVTPEGFDSQRTLNTLRTGIRFARVPRGNIARIFKDAHGHYYPIFDIVFMFLRDGIGGLNMPGEAIFTRVYPRRDEDHFVVTVRELEGQLTVVTEGCSGDEIANVIFNEFLKKLRDIK